MKYRELTPNEIEAYDVGYKVGNRKMVITDIEWESDNEHKIYRKGYMAGLMDYKRNVSKVSSVSNVEIETSTTSITPTTPIGISIRNSIENKEIGGMGEKEKEPVSKIDFDTTFKAGGQLWTLPPNFRKLALTRYTESEIREFEKAHSCHENPEDVCLNDIKHQPKPKKTVEISDYGEYEPLREQITKWIEYKKARKESYKTEQSLMAFAKKLFTLSGGKPDIADQIIEQSMANNWAGIFELKQNQKKEKINFSFYTGEGSFLKPDGEW